MATFMRWIGCLKLRCSVSVVVESSLIDFLHFVEDERVKVFITHLGANSYLEASYAGKPLIATPFFVDQYV